MKKVLITFATLALGIASAASANKVYHMSLAESAWVGGNELKPGDYRIEIDGNNAVIKSGKNVAIQAPAKVETSERKFDTTQVQIENANTKPHIKEIDFGGTTTKLVFNNTGAPVE